MKKTTGILAICIILLSAFSLNAQTTKSFKIGEIAEIRSAILGENRTMNIYLPEGYNAKEKYPVIYLLDGTANEDFLHIVGLVQFFNMTFKMPNTIVVGIANIDRKRDFTFPTKIEELKKAIQRLAVQPNLLSLLKKNCSLT